MGDPEPIIFIHGLYSSSQSVKAVHLRELFPGILTPDFTGTLRERMDQLEQILGSQRKWTVIGSSLGGLMGAVFTVKNPHLVRKLVLLAPALMLPEFTEHLPPPVSTPTVIVHGTLDQIVPLQPVQRLAKKVFKNLTYLVVRDDHRLHKTIYKLDWNHLVE